MSRAAVIAGNGLRIASAEVITTCGPILARAIEASRAGTLDRLELPGGGIITSDQLHQARISLLNLAQELETP